MSKYKYILFDLDGTLFDINKVESVALKQVLEQNNLTYNDDILSAYSKINDDLWLKFEVGELTKDQVRLKRFELLKQKFYIKTNVDALKIASEYFNLFSKTVIAFDGAKKVLETLFDKYDLYVVSNGSVDVQYYKLNKLDFTKYFNKIFLSEEIGYAKPNKLFFENVYNKLGKPEKESVLIVGDSISADIEGGNSFGFDTCYIGEQNCDFATFKIKNISFLTDII